MLDLGVDTPGLVRRSNGRLRQPTIHRILSSAGFFTSCEKYMQFRIDIYNTLSYIHCMPPQHGKETIVNPFFQAIQSANRAHCAALGLSAADLYGTEPNAAEVETHDLIAAVVPAEAAEPLFRASKAKHLKHWQRTPIQRLGYIEARIKQGCSPLPEGGTA